MRLTLHMSAPPEALSVLIPYNSGYFDDQLLFGAQRMIHLFVLRIIIGLLGIEQGWMVFKDLDDAPTTSRMYATTTTTKSSSLARDLRSTLLYCTAY